MRTEAQANQALSAMAQTRAAWAQTLNPSPRRTARPQVKCKPRGLIARLFGL